MAAQPATTFDDLMDQIKEMADPSWPPLLAVLDGVEDPHNLGAVIRTAEAAGAHGVIIPERRAAGLTSAVAKASAGALSHLPVARVGNLAQAMEKIKEAGIWLFGLDTQAKTAYSEADWKGPVALVAGAEGRGLRPLVKEQCDQLVSLPMRGRVESLNVSVAVGIVLYEIVRQRTRSESL
jgi:23S rRNA (guanosine2251-2'-O)-methyltransferase